MEKLFLSEIFESIQGETSLSGVISSFIRLAGCPVGCSWCDSSYAFEKGMPKSFEELFSALEKFGWKYVCITGGEPLIQKPVIPFMAALTDKGYTVSLETSGCFSIKSVPEKVITILDVKCPGSGVSHKNLFDNFELLRPHDQVKFVLADRQDFDWAKNILFQHALFSKVSEVLFSPVWGGEISPKNLVAWIQQEKIPVRLNLQLHKYIWGSTLRGV